MILILNAHIFKTIRSSIICFYIVSKSNFEECFQRTFVPTYERERNLIGNGINEETW